MAGECPDRAEWDWEPAYQWNLSDIGCTEIDADAVGIGVVIAFVLGAAVLVIVVTGAFIWSSISVELINSVDSHLMGVLQAWLGMNPTTSNQQLRCDAVNHFLLALSDQQMVTALALLIAAYGQWRRILVYSMVVTGNLVLLASTVYLPVFPIVKKRRGHVPNGRRQSSLQGLARHLRFILTLFNIVGMIFLFVLTEAENWWPSIDTSDLYFSPAVHHFSLSTDFTTIINLFILLQFVIAYGDVAVCLYSDDLISVMDWLARYFEDRNCPRPRTIDYIRIRAGLFSNHMNFGASRPPAWLSRFYLGVLDESYAFNEVSDSFAVNFVMLTIFAFIYGTINIFVSRDGAAAKKGVSGDPNTWGFGQIVPMVLLVLPILAAFEARGDYVNDIKPGTDHIAPQDPSDPALSDQGGHENANVKSLASATSPGEQQSSKRSNATNERPTRPSHLAVPSMARSSSQRPMLHNASPMPKTTSIEMAAGEDIQEPGTDHNARPQLTRQGSSYIHRDHSLSDQGSPSRSRSRGSRLSISNTAASTPPQSPSPSYQPASNPLQRAQQLLDAWQTTTPEELLLQRRRVLPQIYIHLVIIFVVNISMAINVGLSNLGSDTSVVVLGRIAFGYDLAFTVRAVYSCLAIRFYTNRQPKRPLVKSRAIRWMKPVAVGAVVVGLAVTGVLMGIGLGEVEGVAGMFFLSLGASGFLVVIVVLAWAGSV